MAFNKDQCLKFTALEDSCVISIGVSPIDSSHYYFSKDGTTWVPDTITINKNESAYCRGTRIPATEYQGNTKFTITKKVTLSGRLSSLIDDGAAAGGTIPADTNNYAFQYLFADQPVVSVVSGFLDFSSLTSLCYFAIFSNTLISEIPEDLINPEANIVRGLFRSMFSGTKITKVPAHLTKNLTSITRDCFRSAFSNCAELVEIESGFFKNVPAAGRDAFIGTFNNCPKLKKVPPIVFSSVNQSAFFQGMFENCSSLEKIVLNIPEVSGGDVMTRMFKGCSNLKMITVKFEEWPTATDWVVNVAEDGIFWCPEDLEQTFDSSHIPTNWRVNPDGHPSFSANLLQRYKIGGRVR